MKTINRSFKFLVVSAMLLASILACSVPPILVPTLVPTVPGARGISVSTTGHDTPTCGPVATPCLTVTWAVTNRAQAGSGIFIGAGTFLERGTILVTKPLTFSGASRTLTVLSSRGPGLFEIAAGVDVHVEELTINHLSGASSNAIKLDGGSGSLEMARVNMQANAGTALNVSYGSVASITNSLFTGNHVAIHNDGGLQLTNNTILQNNTAGIYSTGVAAIDAANFTGNGGAAFNPAIKNSKATASASAILSVTHSTFANNTGAGVMNDLGGRTSVSNSSFGMNLVEVANNGGSVTIEDCVFSFSGGSNQTGIYLAGSSANPAVDEVKRTAILSNPIGVYLINNSTARLENVTISGSSAGANLNGGHLELAYSTVVHNNSGIALAQGGTATVTNSIIALNTTSCPATGVSFTGNRDYACNDSLSAAALGLGALSPAAGTQVYALLAGSPAIDSASGDCPAVDQRGYRRPYDGNGDHVAVCDVGAYEFGTGLHLEAGPTETPGIIQILPSETPTAALTGTPTAALIPTVTFIQNGNCRKGPGPGYNIVTSFATGAQAPALGRNEQNTWVYLPIPNTTAFCWVGVPSVTVNVPVETLALVQAPILPEAPGKFNDKADCEIKLKTLTVQLSWADVANASGYHLYRNGTLLASPNWNVSTYLDKTAPLGHDLLYELEAFNANGSSARVQTTVSACK